MTRTVPMCLTASLSGTGAHPAGWRVSACAPWPIGRRFQEMAQTAERGTLDAVLLGEAIVAPSPSDFGRIDSLRLDALPLLGSLIATTSRIGLAATWAVDFTEPYNVARVFATLDHLAGGRTGWIVGLVSGAELAPFFGHAANASGGADYVERAREFIDLTRALWDSWEDEAFLLDKPSGRFASPEKVHPVHHAGRFFTVRGPLNVPRPIQGHPVVIQHDPGTQAGRNLAAQTADVLLTFGTTATESRALAHEIRALAVSHGRAPEALRILATVMPILGSTESAARKAADALDALIEPAPIVDPSTFRFIGTPDRLVDLFETWFEDQCCDGFNIVPSVLPDDLAVFVDTVVPLARARGLMRAEYAGRTLREHLGLARPHSRRAA